MSQPTPQPTVPSAEPAPTAALRRPLLVRPLVRLHERAAVYLELGKARLSGMVVATAAVGFLLGSRGVVDWGGFLWLVAGASLTAWAANALNQVIEAERDARMPRTRGRPLPAGRIGPMHAAAVAVFAAGMGLTLLAANTTVLAAALCLATILVYLLVYTPLKVRTPLNTLVGGVVGALPPMMGWAAATGSLAAGAWVLGAVLFIWQIPHFLALAWMYRDDYRRGGYRMLPLDDPTGRVTGRAVLIWSLAMLPVTLAATWVGLSGWVYALGAMALAAVLVQPAMQLYRRAEDGCARRLFIGSVIYLPLLMGLMVADPGPARQPRERPSAQQPPRLIGPDAAPNGPLRQPTASAAEAPGA